MSDDRTNAATGPGKWRLGPAFLWGAGLGALISVAGLLAGGDLDAGTTNRAQAGGASLAPFILPALTGGIGVTIAALRNIFVK